MHTEARQCPPPLSTYTTTYYADPDPRTITHPTPGSSSPHHEFGQCNRHPPHAIQSQHKRKTCHHSLELQGVPQNGRVSPGQVLAGSEHLVRLEGCMAQPGRTR